MSESVQLGNDDVEHTMKPMLAMCVQQALGLALVDVAMWAGKIPAKQLAEGGPYRLLPGQRVTQMQPMSDEAESHSRAPFLDRMWAVPGPGTINEMASENGITLVSFEQLQRRGGWVEQLTFLEPGYRRFMLDGDDRWWFYAHDDLELDVERYPTDEEREAWRSDPYLIPACDFDWVALAQNVTLRLFGSGGWQLPGPEGGYAGNMSAREVFEASFVRPDQNHTAEVAASLRGALEQ